MEIWKAVKDHEGKYEVSSLGRVKRLARVIEDSLGRKRPIQSKILVPFMLNSGYQAVKLGDKHYLIHRLVAGAFIPNPDGKPQVNHKDENKLNNHADNLEWMTKKENEHYGTAIQRRAEKQSKKVYQYSPDGKLVKVWKSTVECKNNGFNRTGIWFCCTGKHTLHKGYRWSYEPLQGDIS